MKLKKYILAGSIALSFGGFFAANSVTANAKHYTTVPSSLRGHWYHYDSDTGQYSKLAATKYHFNMDGIHFYGNRFPKYARGHSQMFVYRNSKGYYNIGKYATDEWPWWKRATKHGHAALREVVPQLPGYSTYYWYRTKSIAKHPTGTSTSSKTISNYDLDYTNAPSSLTKCIGKSVFTTYLADTDYSVDLATSKDNYMDQKFAMSLERFGVPMILQKFSSTYTTRLGVVLYQGQTYYVDADSLDSQIVPYNTYVSHGTAYSGLKPTDKSEILVKNNQYVNTKDEWDYVDPNTGNEIYYKFSLMKDEWVQEKD
ncbi:hypothetical protein [Lentilactobacillus diolivorans]|uniref:Surface layer protein A domain-containing protein n=2 Tax=Lentilactobacillus diolivorans TaxID=179838 RepID=A0A0R1SB38_9LACO|nr:hypothetical protein [Lentilactobacillus diolivorans]KRL63573.1 hypothetical protein FC85_GL001556 [Lentilactobacillus diolivorans DSM 14421]GEP25234.1 hypothetical protein LDI01_28270 [Lentilactobacillus diolivorans]